MGVTLLLIAASGVSPISSLAQRGVGGQQIPQAQPVTVQINVRESNGMPLDANAVVTLSAQVGGYNKMMPTRDGGSAIFQNVYAGEYTVTVTSPGYQDTTEEVSVLGAGGLYNAYVNMKKDGEDAPKKNMAPGPPVMTPKLLGIVDQGLQQLKKQNFDEARKTFEKALKMAPGNPDIHYLMGVTDTAQKRPDDARKEFESAIAIYPQHERSLIALGELDLRTGKPAEAADVLERAYKANGADWRTHFLLGGAYFELRDYAKAEQHAERAVELAKGKAPYPILLEGRIAAAQGHADEAQRAYEAIIRDFPNDAAAARAKEELAKLTAPSAPAAITPVATPAKNPEPPPLPPPPPPTPIVVHPWAPPDIDSKEYALAPGVSCTTEEVVRRTRMRTMAQIGNFEKFMATEHIEHIEIDPSGIPSKTRARDFNYLVFIQHTGKDRNKFYLEEMRDGGENLEAFPTSLATKGLVALGVSVFDPQFDGDFDYKCEGMTTWRGKPAWEVRFEQKKDKPSQVLLWKNKSGIFPIPLRGRAWVSANSYDLMHLETDLREPVDALELTKDHLQIDYGPVNFQRGTALWLPWHADMYLDLRGKKYHHVHTLSNYMLFSVDTSHSASTPPPKPEEAN